AMMRTLAQFTVEGFLADSKRLLETARLLGSLRKQARFPVLAKFKEEWIKDDAEISSKKDSITIVNKIDLLKDTIMMMLMGDRQISIDRNIIFSLQVSQLIDANRRAFKRFLKAYFQGERDYLQAHPLTQ